MPIVDFLVDLRQFSLQREALPLVTVLLLVLYIIAGHLLLQTKGFWGALSGALIGLLATLYVFTLFDVFPFDFAYCSRLFRDIIGLS